MRTAEAFYNIFMHLYNKNILEYGQIARNGTESVIPDTEGHSNIYLKFFHGSCQSNVHKFYEFPLLKILVKFIFQTMTLCNIFTPSIDL